MADWTVSDIPSQAGRLGVVTGATGGIGYEAALELARKGAKIIIAARNEAKGADAVRRIKAAIPAADVTYESLDLANLASIARFAARMIEAHPVIDLLVNNAGVMALPAKKMTTDGFEMQFGTNHLGHFALAGRLLPALRRAPAPRVVTVSSSAAHMGKMDFDNLNAEKNYRAWAVYCQSKLANQLFQRELQKRSDTRGWEVLSVGAHPGYARTDLIANGPGAGGLMAVLSTPIRLVASQDAAGGALPTLRAATDPGAAKLSYYGPRDWMELKGPPVDARIPATAKNEADAARLWDVSEQLTGVAYPLA